MICYVNRQKISPLLIENMLKEHHIVSQAMVYGEGKSYLVALITVNGDPRAVEPTVQQKVDEVNRRVSSTESIKKFVILDRDFEIAKDEITPTGKVKRDVVAKRYSNVIEELYA